MNKSRLHNIRSGIAKNKRPQRQAGSCFYRN